MIASTEKFIKQLVNLPGYNRKLDGEIPLGQIDIRTKII